MSPTSALFLTESEVLPKTIVHSLDWDATWKTKPVMTKTAQSPCERNETGGKQTVHVTVMGIIFPLNSETGFPIHAATIVVQSVTEHFAGRSLTARHCWHDHFDV